MPTGIENMNYQPPPRNDWPRLEEPDVPNREFWVRVPPPNPPEDFGLWMARKFRLDSWGRSLLTRPAARSLGTAAKFIALVTVWEWLMWTLLFSFVLSGEPGKMGWHTPIAMLLASIVAKTIFLYECEIVVYDSKPRADRSYLRKLIENPGLVWRAAIVAVSAIATWVPVELYVFRTAIERRLVEETALAEGITYLRGQKDLLSLSQAGSADVAANAQTTVAPVAADLTASEAGLKQEENILALATTAKERADGVVERRTRAVTNLSAEEKRKQIQIDELRGENRDPERLALERERAGLRARRETEQERLLEARRLLAEAREELERARQSRDNATKTVDVRRKARDDFYEIRRKEASERADAAGKTANSNRAFVNSLRRARYGEPLKGPTDHSVRWVDADLFSRLEIVAALFSGRPPRWPLATTIEDQRAVAEEFELPSPGEAEAGAKSTATDLFWSYVLLSVTALMAAVFIPLLVLGFKVFLISPELERYYSAKWQRAAGSPDALRQPRPPGAKLDDGRSEGRP